MARIRCARIIQMTQKTCFPCRAETSETADAINASGAIETGRIHTIVDVYTAISPGPAINAYA